MNHHHSEAYDAGWHLAVEIKDKSGFPTIAHHLLPIVSLGYDPCSQVLSISSLIFFDWIISTIKKSREFHNFPLIWLGNQLIYAS